MYYLVVGSSGPGFMDPAEELDVLQGGVLPTFAHLRDLEKKGRIFHAGLPVGDRTFIFIAKASTHDDLDQMLRAIPAWGLLEWEVTPLQSLASRGRMERARVAELRRAARA